MKKLSYTYLLTFVSTVLFFSPLSAESKNEFPQLTVKGEAQLLKPADQMQLTIGVVTKDADLHQAMKENGSKMDEVIHSLNQVGLTSEEYQSGQFHVYPIYTQRPQDAPEAWQPSINHYEVVNTIQVKTQKLAIADQIIASAASAGANKIEDIQFNLSNPRVYRDEAIKVAAQNGIHDAKVLAEAAQIKLIGIRSLALDQSQHFFPGPYQARALNLTKMESDISVPIEAGNVQVQATVNIVFDIGPK